MIREQNNVAYIDGANLHKDIGSLGWQLDYRRFRIWLSEKYGVRTAYLFEGWGSYFSVIASRSAMPAGRQEAIHDRFWIATAPQLRLRCLAMTKTLILLLKSRNNSPDPSGKSSKSSPTAAGSRTLRDKSSESSKSSSRSMAYIHSFKDLLVWQKAHQLVLQVYRLTRKFPTNEVYGLTAQLRRATFSVASNIVEGFARLSVNDSLHFYNMSDASLEEVRYQLLIAYDLEYISKQQYEVVSQLAEEVSKMLKSWIKSQRKNTAA